jgi:hypothetical protein
MPPIKLRLFGESFNIHALNINKKDLKDFIRISQRLNQPLEEALLNVSFFTILNLRNYSCLETMSGSTFGGLLNTAKNSIEIWSGRKCQEKFKLNDLFKPKTLFPLFNTKKVNLSIKLNNSLFLIEKEVGLIGEYAIECENFDINLLKFEIGEVQYINEHFQLLTSISYDSNILQSQKSDALVIYRHCVNHLHLEP